MQIFEFIFNPKLKKDLVFDSFCYKPQNIYEKKKGSLYMMGILKNTLPNNIYLIKNIAKTIKDKYFQLMNSSSETSLKEGLKAINISLSNKAEKGNISWLGNLSFIALSLKNLKLIFSKTGDIKILILRNGEIVDIDRKTKYNKTSPYPIKVFARTISGKLTKNDFILIFTRDVFDFFKRNGLLNKISQFSLFTEEKIKKILNQEQKKISKVKGVFLGIYLGDSTKNENKKTTLKNLEKISLKDMFLSSLKFFKKIETPNFKFSLLKKRKKLKIKSFSQGLGFFSKRIRPFFQNAKILIITPLLFILLLGFIFFQFEENRKIKIYRQDLIVVQEKITEADNFFILRKSSLAAAEKANVLLKNCWYNLTSLKDQSLGLSKELDVIINETKEQVLSKLYELNNLTELENPELFFEFNQEVFVPHRFLLFNENFYFYNPYSENIFHLKQDKESNIIEIRKKFDVATILNDSIVFFSRPNQLTILKNNFPIYSFLNSYDSNFSPDYFSSFNNNLYFLNKKTGEITKYPFLGNYEWGSPENWLSSSAEKNISADSFTIDRFIWVLKNNLIYKYYTGELVQEIDLDIFPEIKSFSKIFTSPTLSYTYILEPQKQRVIIINKSGQLIKQFISEKFDNLLDFSVSENEKTIYLLNGFNVYKIEF